MTSGTCSDEWGGFKCDCVEGFGGKDCSDQIDVTQQLSGDGYLLFGRHPLVQFPWFVGMSFRTRDVSARLLSVAISNDRSVRLEVSLECCVSSFQFHTYGMSHVVSCSSFLMGKYASLMRQLPYNSTMTSVTASGITWKRSGKQTVTSSSSSTMD